MDASGQPYDSDAALAGLRVLTLLPPSRSDDARVLVSLIEAAKARWKWEIDALCIGSDRPAFEKDLLAPAGKLFNRPGFSSEPAALGS